MRNEARRRLAAALLGGAALLGAACGAGAAEPARVGYAHLTGPSIAFGTATSTALSTTRRRRGSAP